MSTRRRPTESAWDLTVDDGEVALPALIARLGGIATTGELQAHGFTAEIIAAFVAHRQVIRIRRGWYTTPDVDPAVIAAIRVGGRLGCISALEHHGVMLPLSTELHVSVDAGSSRLRLPSEGVVLHWSRRRLAGGWQAVCVQAALQQAARCRMRPLAGVRQAGARAAR
jgi:hypothetical protein